MTPIGRVGGWLTRFVCAGGLAVATPSAGSAQGPVVGQPVDTAVLHVERRPVAVFRAPFGARTPAERAADAARRVQSLIDADAPDSVGTRRIPEGVLLTVGGRGVFTITRSDLDTLSGETLEQAAVETAARLGAALRSAREEQSLGHLLRGAILAAIATVLFLVALRLLRAGRRLLLLRLPAAAGTHLRSVALAGFTLFSADHLLRFTRRTVEFAAWGVGLFIAYLWLAYVLTRFAYTRSWGEALGTYLTTTISQLVLGAIAAIPGLFTVVLIVVATRWLARIVGAFFDAVEGGSVAVPWVHAETANPTKRLATALLWVFAIVVAYPYLPGSDSNVFKGVSVFIGLVLSLGSSGVVNQAMSGLVLMYSRALKPGDYVRVADTEGVVTELGLLSTKICTNKRELVTIPNGVIVGTTTKNYSRLAAGDEGGGVILHTSVTIGYDTPWRQVHALLLAAAERTPGVRRDPAPFVRQTALSDFYVEYQLNAHLNRAEDRIAVLSALHENIQDCFNEQGVQIMSPHYEADPPTPKLAARDAPSAASADAGRRDRAVERSVDRADRSKDGAIARRLES
jgi:small-conductance mechanosensitive channel